ncbi:hypothetical protein MLD38_035295 [Melastoma candidum]|uniref:Uncharacterized protein n=1 Tax=Melastoma candidum TaxID=119954 RepID=A0ACB9MED2_9MYRT|nr:hypothetical protein MLD38_035295 [Melastoma candidum]
MLSGLKHVNGSFPPSVSPITALNQFSHSDTSRLTSQQSLLRDADGLHLSWNTPTEGNPFLEQLSSNRVDSTTLPGSPLASENTVPWSTAWKSITHGVTQSGSGDPPSLTSSSRMAATLMFPRTWATGARRSQQPPSTIHNPVSLSCLLQTSMTSYQYISNSIKRAAHLRRRRLPRARATVRSSSSPWPTPIFSGLRFQVLLSRSGHDGEIQPINYCTATHATEFRNRRSSPAKQRPRWNSPVSARTRPAASAAATVNSSSMPPPRSLPTRPLYLFVRFVPDSKLSMEASALGLEIPIWTQS